MLKSMIAVFVLGFCIPAIADEYTLEKGTIEYRAHHLLKQIDGKCVQPKGKVRCEKQGCEFLVASPVSEFHSGNANRDVHMLESIRGAVHPFVQVSGSFPAWKESIQFAPKVDFAGKSHLYPAFEIHPKLDPETNRWVVDGVMPISLAAHSIKAPSLLGVSIEDDVKIQFHLEFKKGN